MQWAGSPELRRSARLACSLLRHAEGREEASQKLHFMLLGAARAALAVNPETTAIIADALRAAEADAAGLPRPGQSLSVSAYLTNNLFQTLLPPPSLGCMSLWSTGFLSNLPINPWFSPLSSLPFLLSPFPSSLPCYIPHLCFLVQESSILCQTWRKPLACPVTPPCLHLLQNAVRFRAWTACTTHPTKMVFSAHVHTHGGEFWTTCRSPSRAQEVVGHPQVCSHKGARASRKARPQHCEAGWPALQCLGKTHL